MNGQEILDTLSEDPLTLKKFGGVFACDRLPPQVSVDRYCICNTEKWNQEGQHWVLIYFPPDGETEFFDPLGKVPSHEFVPFMGESYMYNTHRYQSLNSSNCAYYCIFFAYMKCRGISFQSVLGLIGKEKSVVRFVKNI